MKEVVEYILAGLIIMSILPIYDYIMTNLYTPPELEVEQSVVAAFTDQVVSFLDEAAIYGNLSSPIVDLMSLIEKRFPHFTQQYRFHIELVSIGIERIAVTQSNDIYVYTRDKGNVTVLIIYNDYTLENKTETSPYTSFPNGTYVYRIEPTHQDKQIIFIVAVLDTGLHRFINYYETESVKKAYIGNYQGQLSMITTSLLDYYSLPDNINGVNLSLVTYSKSKFELLSESVSYGSVSSIYDFGIIWWWFLPIGVYYHVDYDRTKLKYYAVYEGMLEFKNNIYYVHSGSLLVMKAICTYCYKYYFLTGQTNVEPEGCVPQGAEYTPIMAPIYNLPLAVLRDASGDHYIATWYPHRIEIGYTKPSGMPVTTIRVVKRLGMVDYLITVTMWRSGT